MRNGRERKNHATEQQGRIRAQSGAHLGTLREQNLPNVPLYFGYGKL